MANLNKAEKCTLSQRNGAESFPTCVLLYSVSVPHYQNGRTTLFSRVPCVRRRRIGIGKGFGNFSVTWNCQKNKLEKNRLRKKTIVVLRYLKDHDVKDKPELWFSRARLAKALVAVK